MAKTRTAPAPAPAEDLVEENEVEETEDEESNVITPTDLASDLNISAKSLRGFLRREFPREAKAKNTSWRLNEDMVAKATAHFTASDDDEEEGEDDGDEAES